MALQIVGVRALVFFSIWLKTGSFMDLWIDLNFIEIWYNLFGNNWKSSKKLVDNVRHKSSTIITRDIKIIIILKYIRGKGATNQWTQERPYTGDTRCSRK